VQRGELKQDVDLEICIDLIYGPLFYRLLVTGEKLDEAFIKILVTYAFEGIKQHK
jgi:hypothetical protein